MTGDQASGDRPTPTPEQLREEVDVTREELGRTIEALAARADVKARTQEKTAEVKAAARGKAADALARIEGTASHALHAAQDRTPPPVRQKAGDAARVAGRHRVLVLVGAALVTVVVAGAVLRRARRSGGC
ncbi:DUF3618 domain-containing protein [Streptomyces sp. ISL-36]|uniref:DUF3618 domain-containing protein n=1 Tax=Streptomyces sp. ISL-36 TaxID=2819182 RepID=UPI001BECD3E4|nr:DUF3618 domain-containing protein [Streptomyces sp. ISL-36]MBT2442970.1 DUF3618 domain-containing protein [Streptomyces sp. ISL-36]